MPRVAWFNHTGRKSSKTWGKAGIAFDGKGTLFVMLNGATDSTMPGAWLTAFYQTAFLME